MRALAFLALLLLPAPFLAAGAAAAQPAGAQPLDRLLPQIRRDHPGQFLDAEGAETGGNPHYHLKWLTPDGRVMYLDTDARTGRVLRQSPGRDNFDGPRSASPRSGGPPPDRSDEGPGDRRFEGPGDMRPGARRQYRQPGNEDAGRGGFANRFGRGGDGRGGGFMRPDRGGDRDFGNRGGGRGGNRRR
jgi:hypothetical protein